MLMLWPKDVIYLHQCKTIIALHFSFSYLLNKWQNSNCNVCVRREWNSKNKLTFLYLTTHMLWQIFSIVKSHMRTDADLSAERTQFLAHALCHFLNQMHVQCWKALVLKGSEHCVLTWLKSLLFKYVRQEKNNQHQWVQLLSLRS